MGLKGQIAELLSSQFASPDEVQAAEDVSPVSCCCQYQESASMHNQVDIVGVTGSVHHPSRMPPSLAY